MAATIKSLIKSIEKEMRKFPEDGNQYIAKVDLFSEWSGIPEDEMDWWTIEKIAVRIRLK